MTTALHPIDDHDRARWPAPYAGMLAIVLLGLSVIALLIAVMARAW